MNKLLFLVSVILGVLAVSCKKQNEWLDKPKDPNDNTLESLQDFQAVLDNAGIFNATYPTIGQLGCDHYYLNDQIFNLTAPIERNAYLWAKDIFEGRSSTEYGDGYMKIRYANIVLDGLKKLNVNPNDRLEFNSIRGQALFFRSFMFFELASIFCKQYDAQTAHNDLGLSLKLTSDIYEIKQRSNVEATYKQIVDDLITAIPLLPVTSKYKTRPSKPAAYALLARVYLNMHDYVKARESSDAAIAFNTELLDFNDGVPSLAIEYRFPDFKTGNAEVLFYSEGVGYTGIVPDNTFSYGFVDSILYSSYEVYDLRRKFFYEQESATQVKFRGAYTGTGLNFCGLAINEAYLTRAECNARLDDPQAALDDLNLLLAKRYERGKFVAFETNNLDSLLAKILIERKKELPFTSQIRWQDLRRLNADPRFATYITRIIEGETVVLPPNDPKYVYPIPQDEIDRTGIIQNER